MHGNCFALEAVLADIAALGISEVVNLVDHLSGPIEGSIGPAVRRRLLCAKRKPGQWLGTECLLLEIEMGLAFYRYWPIAPNVARTLSDHTDRSPGGPNLCRTQARLVLRPLASTMAVTPASSAMQCAPMRLSKPKELITVQCN